MNCRKQLTPVQSSMPHPLPHTIPWSSQVALQNSSCRTGWSILSPAYSVSHTQGSHKSHGLLQNLLQDPSHTVPQFLSLQSPPGAHPVANTTEMQHLPWSSPTKALDASGHFYSATLSTEGKGTTYRQSKRAPCWCEKKRHRASQTSHIIARQPAAHPLWPIIWDSFPCHPCKSLKLQDKYSVFCCLTVFILYCLQHHYHPQSSWTSLFSICCLPARSSTNAAWKALLLSTEATKALKSLPGQIQDWDRQK